MAHRDRRLEEIKAALAFIEELKDHHMPMLRAADMHELRLAHETGNMIISAEMKLRASRCAPRAVAVISAWTIPTSIAKTGKRGSTSTKERTARCD